tara:strand:+ start:299 stop:556 length:258 start_codon:yes stop_codon:yes gene_type:complete
VYHFELFAAITEDVVLCALFKLGSTSATSATDQTLKTGWRKCSPTVRKRLRIQSAMKTLNDGKHRKSFALAIRLPQLFESFCQYF